MNKNLLDYIKVYKNVLTKRQCKTAVDEMETLDWKHGVFYNNSSGQYYNNPNGFECYMGNTNTSEMLTPIIWNQLHQYIIKDLNFHWFNGWAGYSEVRYNRYTKDTQMDEHADHIQTLFDGERKGIPTLSIIGSFTDEYKGGELVFLKDEVVELNAGDIVVFPSLFLYPHKVMPITEGKRYTYVSWCW